MRARCPGQTCIVARTTSSGAGKAGSARPGEYRTAQEAGRGRERPSSRAGRCQGRTVEAETGTQGAVELGASPTGFSLGCLHCGRTSWVASKSDSGEACAQEGGRSRPGTAGCNQKVGTVCPAMVYGTSEEQRVDT